MQFTALPGGGTTRGTRDRGCLFGPEFALLHSRRMRLQPVANLSNSGQYPRLVVLEYLILGPTVGISTLRANWD